MMFHASKTAPMVMALSAILNTGQIRKSRKSMTQPYLSLSVIFPAAPPMIRGMMTPPEMPRLEK